MFTEGFNPCIIDYAHPKIEKEKKNVRLCLYIYEPISLYMHGDWQPGRLANTADVKSGLMLGRAEELKGLRNFSERWSSEGERNGDRKQSVLHTPKPRMIRVLLHQRWYCFKGILRGSVEMGSRGHTELFKRCVETGNI